MAVAVHSSLCSSLLPARLSLLETHWIHHDIAAPAAAHDGRQHRAVSIVTTRDAGLKPAAPPQVLDDAVLTESSTLSAAPARRRSSLLAAVADDGDCDAVILRLRWSLALLVPRLPCWTLLLLRRATLRRLQRLYMMLCLMTLRL